MRRAKFSRLSMLSTLLTAGLMMQSVAQAAPLTSVSGTPSSIIDPQIIRTHSLSPKANALISDKLDTTSADKVNVIVQLSGQPVSVGKYASELGQQQLSAESIESAVNREQSSMISLAKSEGIDLKVNYQYNTVLNGMEITLPANQIPELAAIPGVKSIHKSRTYYALPVEAPQPVDTATANYDAAPIKQIGAQDAWAKGLTGKGLKVGVIDSGVDYLHPDLKDAYKGGYNSSFNTPDPYEEPPIPKKDDPFGLGFAGTSHGTHVAGTIAGRAKNTGSDVVQKGIAYEADLYVYKVLSRNPKTGSSSGSSAQVIDGIERAVKDKMDVINLSLGSDEEKDPNSPDSIAINNAVLGGIVAVVASGNAGDKGPYFYSMGSPASSQLAISVGAVTSPSKRYQATVASSVYEAVYSLNVMGWKTGQEDFKAILGTKPIEAVYVGLGQDDDYKGKNVAEKITFVSRGSLAFVDKIKNAKKWGAKAIVIFNGNVKKDANGNDIPDLSPSIPGRDNHIDSFIGDDFEYIPAFDMPGEQGRALAAAVLANPTKPFRLTFSQSYPQKIDRGDTMATFSSRGPLSDDKLSIKPDISAPGVNVLSTYPAYGKMIPGASYNQAYKRNNGTSMATPHVAGAALLLKQQHPDWTPFDIRAALANTADGIKETDGTPYDVYSQGAGRMNVSQAVYTPAVLQTVDQITILDKNLNPQEVVNYGSSASFGLMAAGSSAKKEQLQLKNTSDKAVTYKASVKLHPNVTSDPNNPVKTPDVNNIVATLEGIGSDNTLSANAKSTQKFSLSVAPKATAADGVYEGEVLLESAGLPSLHLPFVVHVGKKMPDNGFGLQDMTLTRTVITPSKSTDVSVTLTAKDANYLDLNVYGVDDKYVGTVGQILNKDASGKPQLLAPGTYTFQNIDGTYINDKVDETGKPVVQRLKEGTYKVMVRALILDEKGQPKRKGGELIQYVAWKALRFSSTDDSSTPNNSGGGGGGGYSFGGGSSAEPSDSNPSINAVVSQGQVSASLKRAVTTDGNKLTATIADADLKAALKTESGTPVAVVISVYATPSQQVTVKLTPEQLNTLKASGEQNSVVFSNGSASVALPVSVLKRVPAAAGLNVAVRYDAERASAFADGFQGAKVIGTPVSFAVSAVNGSDSQPISVSNRDFLKSSFIVSGNTDANALGVLYIDNGKVYAVPANVTLNKDGSRTVTVNRPGISTYAAATRAISFTDINTSWAQSHIQALANKLLLNGTSASAFSPKEQVTRAQFSAMLVRALGLHAGSKAPFQDVSASDWFADDIAAAYEAGLVNGVAEGRFDPHASISRQDLAVMLSRASSLIQLTPKSNPSRKPYADASKFAEYAMNSIEAVTKSGLMSGDEIDGTPHFHPADPTTREAAATVLFNLLQNGNLMN
ncbi:Serine protease, subtilisin family [Paenibacillus tianmuensis]|uniref:Serine protease, subtilisin family n=1 Tax=Paenibacillus tianmuensis TaxID=624147 RepID=A0A1G4TUK5_9BACL|nr:S8 family serine peptidase [Paenibacillus tianmuensis]SCW84299.1 Serine protease, subtilisin family [Paenibacillus tianmuensis]